MVITVFGKRGSGKTTLIRRLLPYCPGPVVVLDILGNYNKESLIDKLGKVEPFETDDLSEAIEYLEDWTELENSENKEKKKYLIVQTLEPSVAVDYLSQALREIECGTLILDEADAIDINDAPNFDWIIRYGRNKNIHLVTGVRRPAELSRNITAAANKMYLFGTHEPRDVEYYSKTLLGDRADELIKIEKYSGIFVDYDKGLIGKFRIDIGGNIYQTEIVEKI